MHQTAQRLLAGSVLATAALTSTVHATTLDFESAALTGVYFPGESFSLSGFTLTALTDAGTVDTAAALGFQAPTGNATQFYFNSNNGSLKLVADDGGTFSLDGFKAAFVPLDPASAQVTVLMAKGTTQSNAQLTAFWSFAPAAPSAYPFSTYNNAAVFSAFTGLTQVEFYACSYVNSQTCTQALNNNGQFAIDDILVTAAPIPEPATALLLALGACALTLNARRLGR